MPRTLSQPARMTAMPDRGCEVAPRCEACPLADCAWDPSESRNRWRAKAMVRREAILAYWREHPLATNPEIAKVFLVHSGTVSRAIASMREGQRHATPGG